jgi:hypothetical protein
LIGGGPVAPVEPVAGVDERRRRVRRSALVLGLVAFLFYAGFIVMSVMRAHS